MNCKECGERYDDNTTICKSCVGTIEINKGLRDRDNNSSGLENIKTKKTNKLRNLIIIIAIISSAIMIITNIEKITASENEVEVYNYTVNLENKLIDIFLGVEGVEKTYELNMSAGNRSNSVMINRKFNMEFMEVNNLRRKIDIKKDDYQLDKSNLNERITYLYSVSDELENEIEKVIEGAEKEDWDVFESQVEYINRILNPTFANEKGEYDYLN